MRPDPMPYMCLREGMGCTLSMTKPWTMRGAKIGSRKIHQDAGTRGKTAVTRWCERRGLEDAMCKRRQRKAPGCQHTSTFYEITDGEEWE